MKDAENRQHLVQELMRYAAEDLAGAKQVTRHPEGIPRHACVNAQGSAEKHIKAVLCAENKRILKTHDLSS